jgi:hypothetical protein
MTWVGKILVLVNLAVSLILAAWALALYTGRVDWSNQRPSAERPKLGEVYQRRERIQQANGYALWDQVVTAENRWRAASRVLPYQEKALADNRTWYAAQLQELRGAAPTPVQDVVYTDGNLVLDDKALGRPKMQEAKDKAKKPLRGEAHYVKAIADTQAQINTTLAELNRMIKEETDLTKEIGGPEGLRVQLATAVDKHEQVLVEQQFVKPLLINAQVESELVLKRHRQLQARRAELLLDVLHGLEVASK